MRNPDYNESDWQREERYLEEAQEIVNREEKRYLYASEKDSNGIAGKELCDCGAFAEEHVRGRFCESRGKQEAQGILFEELE